MISGKAIKDIKCPKLTLDMARGFAALSWSIHQGASKCIPWIFCLNLNLNFLVLQPYTNNTRITYGMKIAISFFSIFLFFLCVSISQSVSVCPSAYLMSVSRWSSLQYFRNRNSWYTSLKYWQVVVKQRKIDFFQQLMKKGLVFPLKVVRIWCDHHHSTQNLM